MSALKRLWSEAMGCLADPPSDMRSWLKIVGAVTLFSLLWGLMISVIIISLYSLEPPKMNWTLPSMMYLSDQMMNTLFETAVLQGSVLIFTLILCGQKRLGILLLLSVLIKAYYGWEHS